MIYCCNNVVLCANYKAIKCKPLNKTATAFPPILSPNMAIFTQIYLQYMRCFTCLNLWSISQNCKIKFLLKFSVDRIAGVWNKWRHFSRAPLLCSSAKNEFEGILQNSINNVITNLIKITSKEKDERLKWQRMPQEMGNRGWHRPKN